MIDFNDIYMFEWHEIQYLAWESPKGEDVLRTLNVNQEKSLRILERELVGNYIELSKLDMEERDEQSYKEHMYGYQDRLLNSLKRQQRYSLVISVFSFFESKLKNICELVESEFSFIIKISDLKSKSDLSKFKKYLAKVYEMDFSSSVSFFDKLTQQKYYRNRMAHHDGSIENSSVQNFYGAPGVKVENVMGELKIFIDESEYIEFLLENIEKFFENLLIAIDKRYAELKAVGGA